LRDCPDEMRAFYKANNDGRQDANRPPCSANAWFAFCWFSTFSLPQCHFYITFQSLYFFSPRLLDRSGQGPAKPQAELAAIPETQEIVTQREWPGGTRNQPDGMYFCTVKLNSKPIGDGRLPWLLLGYRELLEGQSRVRVSSGFCRLGKPARPSSTVRRL
jgi:hypothetical protein